MLENRITNVHCRHGMQTCRVFSWMQTKFCWKSWSAHRNRQYFWKYFFVCITHLSLDWRWFNSQQLPADFFSKWAGQDAGKSDHENFTIQTISADIEPWCRPDFTVRLHRCRPAKFVCRWTLVKVQRLRCSAEKLYPGTKRGTMSI